MTFPRPCLYALLAACLLLPGCVANQYAIKINAITNGDIQAGIGDVYYIMAVKGQEDDLVFLELKRNLESALPQAGLKVTKSLPHATAVLFAGYKSQTVARQTTVSEPVYGVTRVETRTTGTGRGSKTSVSTPTYGVTGYKNTQKEVAQNKIVLLLAADSLKTKKKMWETIVTYTGNSFDNRKMLDMMVMGAKDYLAQTTPGDTWLDVSESDDGALSLKESPCAQPRSPRAPASSCWPPFSCWRAALPSTPCGSFPKPTGTPTPMTSIPIISPHRKNKTATRPISFSSRT